jgi:hypothetical protein
MFNPTPRASAAVRLAWFALGEVLGFDLEEFAFPQTPEGSRAGFIGALV